MPDAANAPAANKTPGFIRRYIAVYRKTGKAAYLPHLSLMQVMERALLRARITPRFTEGFNPRPCIEFAQPSPVGAESLEEAFSFELREDDSAPPGETALEELIARLNAGLPDGLCVSAISSLRYREKGKKPPSLMSLYAGGRYSLEFSDPGLAEQCLAALESDEKNKGAGGLALAIREPGKLVIDYTGGPDAKGFWALLKQALGERISGVKLTKLKTFARRGDALGSYAEI
jgi:radical SAM-linked protein